MTDAQKLGKLSNDLAESFFASRLAAKSFIEAFEYYAGKLEIPIELPPDSQYIDRDKP